MGFFRPKKHAPFFFCRRNCVFFYINNNLGFFGKKIYIWVQKVTRSTMVNPDGPWAGSLRGPKRTQLKKRLHYGHCNTCWAPWRISPHKPLAIGYPIRGTSSRSEEAWGLKGCISKSQDTAEVFQINTWTTISAASKSNE